MKKLNIFLISLLVLSACSDDNKIGNIPEPVTDFILPQGGNAEADATIKGWYDKYDTYFLYDFTDNDLNWTLVGGGMFDTQYRSTALDHADVPNTLSAVQDAWLSLYSDSLNQQALPKFVYLTKTLESGELSYSYVEDGFVMKWTKVSSCHLDNQIALSAPDTLWSMMTSEEKTTYKSRLQTTVLNYLVSSGHITIPESFYAVSSYTDVAPAKETAARNAGFVKNPSTNRDWSISASSLSRSDDLDAYLASFAFYTDSDWRTLTSRYTKIKQKYDLLVNTFATQGIDITKIGNVTY